MFCRRFVISHFATFRELVMDGLPPTTLFRIKVWMVSLKEALYCTNNRQALYNKCMDVAAGDARPLVELQTESSVSLLSNAIRHIKIRGDDS